MKKILAILILIFTLQTPSSADDIRDFQIEGISIGDSLLDYFSKSEIQNAEKDPYYHKDKFIQLEIKTKNSQTYDFLRFTWEQKDNNYKLYGLAGIIDFPNNFNSCIETQKEVIESVEELFPNIKKREAGKKFSVYDKSKKSYFIETYFEFKDGSMVRIYCENWSKELTNKNGWVDNLAVIISDIKFLDFLRSTY